jgi:hypothetical protein
VRPVAQTYFLAMVFGLPLVLVAIAMFAGYVHGDGYADLLDWKPTRSPEREAELEHGEVEQMLAAQNRHRRRRGAPERTLDDVTGHAWAGLDRYGEADR